MAVQIANLGGKIPELAITIVISVKEIVAVNSSGKLKVGNLNVKYK